MGRKKRIDTSKALSFMIGKETSSPESPPTPSPQADLGSKHRLFRATVILSEWHDRVLEELRYRRRRAGQKVSKSDLVREAIEDLARKEGLIPEDPSSP